MYCAPEELKQYVFQKYLDKIEQLEPGIIAGHISGVCAEIDDALRPRFVLPLANPPETVRRIARVLAAYRCVGSITSLMKTEASSENVWLPLQTQYKQAVKQLETIAGGKMDLGLEALGNEPDDGGTGIAVSSRPGQFDTVFWSKF